MAQHRVTVAIRKKLLKMMPTTTDAGAPKKMATAVSSETHLPERAPQHDQACPGVDRPATGNPAPVPS